MLRPEHLLTYGQRRLIQRPSHLIIALVIVESSQVVEAGCGIGMVGAEPR